MVRFLGSFDFSSQFRSQESEKAKEKIKMRERMVKREERLCAQFKYRLGSLRKRVCAC